MSASKNRSKTNQIVQTEKDGSKMNQKDEEENEAEQERVIDEVDKDSRLVGINDFAISYASNQN